MIYELYKSLQDYLEIGSRRLIFLISVVTVIIALSPIVYLQWKKKVSISNLFVTRRGHKFLVSYLVIVFVSFITLYYFKTKFNINFFYGFSLSEHLPFDFLKPEYP